MSLGEFLPHWPQRRSRRSEDAEIWLQWIFEKDASVDPALGNLGRALCNCFGWMESYVERFSGEKGRTVEFAERVYNKLKHRIHSLRNLEASIVTELKYELRKDRAVTIKAQLPLRPVGDLSDPRGLEFVADLIQRDEIQAFRSCMEEDFRELFDTVFITSEDESRKTIAARLGISRNTLDQRLRRGLLRTQAKFRKQYYNAP